MKYAKGCKAAFADLSPLAEGRELKCIQHHRREEGRRRRPSRRGVN